MTAVAKGLDAHVVLHRGRFRLDAHLVVAPGTTTVLLGPNGAGKSTAVGAVAGLTPIDDGRIELAGRVLDDPATGVLVPAPERRVGVVFQRQALFPHLDARDNVAFGLVSRGTPRREARDRAAAWLDRLGLAHLARHRPERLSGGQAQQVALARALVTEPDLLVLDEPLSALDVTTRGDVRRLLLEHLAAFAGPRLVITHDPTEAFLLADDVHLLEAGRTTQVGTVDDIRRRPRTPYAADLVGVNLLHGTAVGGVVTVDDLELVAAATPPDGPTAVRIHPRAIALHRHEPEGSPRNAWPTTVTTVEPLGGRTRVVLAAPAGLTAEVTGATATEMGLAAGTPVWVSIKATQLTASPAVPVAD